MLFISWLLLIYVVLEDWICTSFMHHVLAHWIWLWCLTSGIKRVYLCNLKKSPLVSMSENMIPTMENKINWHLLPQNTAKMLFKWFGNPHVIFWAVSSWSSGWHFVIFFFCGHPLFSISQVFDLHRHKIDHITIPSQRGPEYGVLRRVDDVRPRNLFSLKYYFSGWEINQYWHFLLFFWNYAS